MLFDHMCQGQKKYDPLFYFFSKTIPEIFGY